MKWADFLVDFAAVAQASRAVAAKHAELRAQQLERFSRTSSIAAALRQTRETPSPAPEAPDSVQNDAPPSAAPAEPVIGDNYGEDAEARHDSAPSASPVQNLRPTSVPSEQSPVFTTASTLASSTRHAPAAPAFKPAPWADAATFAEFPVSNNRPSKGTFAEASRASRMSKANDVLAGVDLGIFHTRRGASILEATELEDAEAPARLDAAHAPITAGSRVSDAEKSSLGPIESAREVDVPVNAGVRSATDESASSTATAEGGLSDPVPEPENVTVLGSSADQGVDTRREAEPERSPHKPVVVQSDVEAAKDLGAEAARPVYELRESKVPSSRVSRLWNYGGLAAGMFGGAVSESLSRAFGSGGQGSVMLSSGNMERLVAKLSRMRGAALKLGQMISFQDSKMLPAPIQEVLQRVQDRADYMPAWQRNQVLVSNLGPEWRELYDEFDEKPIAAASIGQVHRARLKDGTKVAVKIQFPGVADSINSDLDNLGILLSATKLLPKGLYLNKTIDNARTELAWECDYIREAECGQRFRELMGDETDVFSVPQIFTHASGKQVLTMEFMEGMGVTRVRALTQEQKDWVGTHILRLCLREITEFRFMQTDPNWTNFLYNADKQRLELLDFGASREYPEHFINLYVRLLEAASRSDRDTVQDLSVELGYLTGHESKTMLDAHIASVLTLAEPFSRSAPELYDFSDQTITERVKALIPVMIRERLAPPPEETYSLHRKLSGAFLLCAKMGSQVRCRELFEESILKSGILKQET